MEYLAELLKKKLSEQSDEEINRKWDELDSEYGDMTDIELLTIDLCSRLPYIDTMVQWQNEDYQMISIGFGRVTLIKPLMSITAGSPLITEVKPYLRPMSSMTEKEMDEFEKIDLECDLMPLFDYVSIAHYRIFDWLNKNHFDYRGLIEKGLALEAPEGMYNN